MATPSFFRADGWVKSAVGPAVPGAQIYVCSQPANVDTVPPSPLSSLFEDASGLVPIVQPVLTDGFGHYDFYIAPGTYTLVVALGGVIQQVYPDQSFGLAGESASGVQTVKVNGVNTSDQNTLNLVAGSGITLTPGSSGTVTISNSGVGGGITDFFLSNGAMVQQSVSATGSVKGASDNLVLVMKIDIPAQCTVHKVSFVQADGNDPNENLSLALYDSSGNKILDTGVLVFDAGAGSTKTVTLSSPVVIAAGTYYFAQSAQYVGSPSNPVNTYTWGTTTNASLDKGAQLYQSTATRFATAANSRSGGVMPSTLGALTPLNTSNICAAMFS